MTGNGALCVPAFDDRRLAQSEKFRTINDRVANCPEVDQCVQDQLGRRTHEENIGLLETGRIAYGRFSDMENWHATRRAGSSRRRRHAARSSF
ncbi:MAG: hypothetical protein KDA73_17195 [Rhodobacteraceae bacterium]|nr:hypothetical protein [Paracoccaceae bacterium]